MICAYLLFDRMLLEMVCALLKDVQITNATTLSDVSACFDLHNLR